MRNIQLFNLPHFTARTNKAFVLAVTFGSPFVSAIILVVRQFVHLISIPKKMTSVLSF